MIVVADSSPLVVLINIGHVPVIPALFGNVIIPTQVRDELASDRRPTAVREFIANPPSWLSIREPRNHEPIPLLHAGEVAAIHLAKELSADLLLIDEAVGRRAAAERGIALTGTIGVLERAAKANLLDLKEAFERIKQTDFWISEELLDARLRWFNRSNKREVP